jgi:TonB family protein
VSGRTIRRWITAGVLALAVTAVGTAAWGQQSDELTRKIKNKVQPVYPDVARRMGIAGTVKVQVVVAPNGSIKSTKLVGGHPLLANAALDAVKKWRFEPASEETTGIVEFKFDAQQ